MSGSPSESWHRRLPEWIDKQMELEEQEEQQQKEAEGAGTQPWRADEHMTALPPTQWLAKWQEDKAQWQAEQAKWQRERTHYKPAGGSPPLPTPSSSQAPAAPPETSTVTRSGPFLHTETPGGERRLREGPRKSDTNLVPGVITQTQNDADRGLQPSSSAVLEANWKLEARVKLADHLRFPGGMTVEIVRAISTVIPPPNARLLEYPLPVSASKFPDIGVPAFDPYFPWPPGRISLTSRGVAGRGAAKGPQPQATQTRRTKSSVRSTDAATVGSEATIAKHVPSPRLQKRRRHQPDQERAAAVDFAANQLFDAAVRYTAAIM
ncbi:hypothetical protein B0H19DRAFT_1060788 [Mycena capillaripes]|nr:hypothetical protein B0H19DRAFT_1060788 [Mycena capillaripes]